MSKAEMIKNVKEVKEIVIDDLMINDLLAQDELVLAVEGDNFLLHLNEVLTLTLKDIKQVINDKHDADGNVVSYSRSYDIQLTDGKEAYIMHLFSLYISKKTGKIINLTDVVRKTMQSIVDLTKSKTLGQAMGKQLNVTAVRNISGSTGKPYTSYTIEAAE